ncbi:uncharacterized protein CC84DRAFT_1080790 [Paraphaeosphaeria sporulosa]|uniref:DNA-directed DNA polymerase n=1 Tax=Paraphaeosphaeria sporulosa TaxID=1460663 RepID=A0A177D1I2_9PLEO|nr:uncharacterized protein CC84DRAFT_1080790 [Paraphaeosphaeria sporulosa]OAG12889.1 hypothetical protein CC84DRAFT_1080790 [Paraphaeosphaeria sporulosa]
MANKYLQEKVAYFQQQDLLDLSEDDEDYRDPGLLAAERLLGGSAPMPPPPPIRRGSGFLGPTPPERQQEFKAHTTKYRAVGRECDPGLMRSSTAPESITQSFPVTTFTQRHGAPQGKLKKTASMSDIAAKDLTPFHKRMGEIPRELKNANAKAAYNIIVEPEHKQLLKEKIVYFFPNNDISMARRLRIHKIIQLGAAWVKTWRDDITHVIFDDDKHTYPQLLRHLSRAGLPGKVVVVRFDPYIPQCIQSSLLLDPSKTRFLVKGAPRPNEAPTPTPPESQDSLVIKASRRELTANSSQKTDSVEPEDTPAKQHEDDLPTSSGDIVKDSFVQVPESPILESAKLPEEFNDELSQAIRQSRAVAHLPLDDEEESESRPTSSASMDFEFSTDEEKSLPSPKRTRSQTAAVAPRKKFGVNQNTFQCMNPMGTSSPTSNPNARTIEMLEQMGKYYDQTQDQWRTLAYRKAVTTLRKQHVQISTAKEAAALPFIGSRLADKIEEIVLTNRLRRLDSVRDDPTDKILRLFLGVYGAGLVQANKWIQAGHRTLDDLLAKAKLTDAQKVGIEHYHDFATRIPRAEVKAHGDHVRNALQLIDLGFQATVMGSYRRGAKDSGDIDIIITKPGATVSTLRDVVFHTLVPRLLKTGFLKVKLATSSSSKWHGVSCLPLSTTWRRLDLLLVPEEEMGAALLYFTGNDIFNRSIRLLASKKGMRLNQRGLYKNVIRGRHGEKLNEGTLIEGRDERKIFEILGVPWREPTERIC